MNKLKLLNLRHEKRYNRWHGLYECECGKQTIVDNAKVKSGHSTSCGCNRKVWASTKGQEYNKAKKRTLEQTQQKLFKSYSDRAKLHNREFTLSFEAFVKLINASCVYCGEVGSNEIDNYFYNGIDRVDSSLGYTTENSATCCKMCNYLKQEYSVSEYLSHVAKVYQYQKDKRENDLADLLMQYAKRIGANV